MLRRGLALCLLAGMASVAQAGAVITLVPTAPEGGGSSYAQDEQVFINVMLTQEAGGSDLYLRYAQLDFNATDAGPNIFMPIAHDLTGPPDIRFWDFLSTPDCPEVNDIACGQGHYIEDAFMSVRPRVISTAYYFVSASNLAQDTDAQRKLAGDQTPLKLGTFVAIMPMADGTYTIDVLNATETNPDVGGADIRFGFGTDVPPDNTPITVWRADTGELTGDSLCLAVGAATCGGAPTVVAWESVGFHARINAGAGGDIALELAESDLSSEPRLSGVSEVVVRFDNPIDPGSAIPANVTTSGCDVGNAAVDLTGIVTTVATSAGDTELVITYTPKLPDYARYLISLNGVTGGGSAVLGDTDRVVTAVLGDANGDRRVRANDVGGARSFIGVDPIDPANVFQVRSDANNDGRIRANDIGGIRSMIGNDARNITCP